jgi:RNA polymerase sigma-70 factor (ECF subfamily)
VSKRKAAPGMDETTLIQRARRLDRAAISTLYRQHVQAIYRYVYYRVGDASIAEDLTAEVFLRAIEGLPDYEPRGVPFAAWLYRIAHARVADHFRRQRRAETVALDESHPSGEDSPLAKAERSSFYENLEAALRQLTLYQQQVIILKFIEGLSNAEVAQILNKTEGAVKSLQHRALNALHRLMGRSDEKRRT